MHLLIFCSCVCLRFFWAHRFRRKNICLTIFNRQKISRSNIHFIIEKTRIIEKESRNAHTWPFFKQLSASTEDYIPRHQNNDLTFNTSPHVKVWSRAAGLRIWFWLGIAIHLNKLDPKHHIHMSCRITVNIKQNIKNNNNNNNNNNNKIETCLSNNEQMRD